MKQDIKMKTEESPPLKKYHLSQICNSIREIAIHCYILIRNHLSLAYNPVALRKAKTEYSFGLSECKRSAFPDSHLWKVLYIYAYEAGVVRIGTCV